MGCEQGPMCLPARHLTDANGTSLEKKKMAENGIFGQKHDMHDLEETNQYLIDAPKPKQNGSQVKIDFGRIT